MTFDHKSNDLIDRKFCVNLGISVSIGKLEQLIPPKEMFVPPYVEQIPFFVDSEIFAVFGIQMVASQRYRVESYDRGKVLVKITSTIGI